MFKYWKRIDIGKRIINPFKLFGIIDFLVNEG